MRHYQTSVSKIKGSDFKEVHKKAFDLFLQIKKKSKRKPYIRSKYFHKQKIFLQLYWEHLFEKENWRDRLRRVKLYAAAIEMLQLSDYEPITRESLQKKGEIFYRFGGISAEGDYFFVHIKEDKKRKQKFLISIFPK